MAIWLRFKEWIIAAGAAIVAIFGIYLYGRSSGANSARQKAAEADRKRARSIEDAADKARATPVGDSVNELREHGRLRD
jgi:hypothetical protein